jgi:ATP-dependent DNA helicase RecG
MLAAKGLFSVSDLLYYAPFRYEDRRNIKAIAELMPGEKAVVMARVHGVKMSGFRRKALGLLEVTFMDGSGQALLGRWFHGERYRDSLLPDSRIALFGKVELERQSGHFVMIQPEIEVLSADDDTEEGLHTGRIVAVYEAAAKISTRVFRRLMHRVLREVGLPEDPLPHSVRVHMELPDLAAAIRGVHVPPVDSDLKLLNSFRTPAQKRLIFDEFFWLECGLALKRTRARAATGISFAVRERAREQIKRMLPFKPTGAQRKVTQEIANDMKQPHPMNRLLQGDVGSGKTIVAAQAAVIALENGYQVAVLAPTEILASQHYSYFRRLLEPLGYTVVLLTGSATVREKQRMKELIARGAVQIAVGTHALIQSDVEFHKLGLAIVDEQHRFGVLQRLRMMEKGTQPDVLVMTATPIPRTLALTLYGDLDVSIIDERPPGRKPIITKHVPEAKVEAVYQFLAQQIVAGRQAYVVYPMVEESETAAMKAAEQMFLHLSQEVFPNIAVGLLHGKLSSGAKEIAMQEFASGRTQILVATTVIEVGVDVSNASVMVIEQAERFGLAQIHQLRGRVGRGPHQSFCVLVTGKLSQVAQERIRTLVESDDGFYIAEMDMKLRGPGEFFGTKQAGVPGLRLGDLLRDGEILEAARYEGQRVVEAGLEQQTGISSSSKESVALREVARYIQENWQRRYGFVQVG